MKNLDYNQILDELKKAIKQAGDEIMRYYKSQDFEVNDKKDDSPVTSADLASNKILLNDLSKYGYGILSEEGVDDQSRLDEELVWIIDPLDGTTDFIDKTEEFTIIVGLVQRQINNLYRPILGAIYQPVTRDIYYAVKDKGAYTENTNGEKRKLSVSNKTDYTEMTMLTSRSHSTGLEKIVAKNLGITNIVSLGSSLKVCLQADKKGELCFNPSDKTWEWDICASDIIIHEAGGCLTDIEGSKIYYNKKNPRNKKGYLATNGIIHDKVVKDIANNI